MDQMFTYAVEKCSEYLTISSAFYDMQSFVKKILELKPAAVWKMIMPSR